jgi:hypothetical protein
MADRIDWNNDGTVDDVVLDAISVHIEDMGDYFWLAVYRSDGDRFVFTFSPKRAGKNEKDDYVDCFMTESSIGSLELKDEADKE